MSTCHQSQSWLVAFLSSCSSKFGHFFPSSSYGCVRSNYCNKLLFHSVYLAQSQWPTFSELAPEMLNLLEKTHSPTDWFHLNSWPHSSHLAFVCPASSPSSLCNHITDFLDKVAVPHWTVLMRLLLNHCSWLPSGQLDALSLGFQCGENGTYLSQLLHSTIAVHVFLLLRLPSAKLVPGALALLFLGPRELSHSSNRFCYLT